MTKEDKQLLLADLCARLATGICTWCGYDANKHAEELGFNNTKND